jgi:hypothetical protein
MFRDEKKLHVKQHFAKLFLQYSELVWCVTTLMTYVLEMVNLYSFLIQLLNYFTVSGGSFHMNGSISRNDTTPIMVVVPGLTSDSSSAVSSVFSPSLLFVIM